VVQAPPRLAQLRDHIVRVGINYAFEPAVVAKY
jgi:hypothetical protein